MPLSGRGKASDSGMSLVSGSMDYDPAPLIAESESLLELAINKFPSFFNILQVHPVSLRTFAALVVIGHPLQINCGW